MFLSLDAALEYYVIPSATHWLVNIITAPPWPAVGVVSDWLFRSSLPFRARSSVQLEHFLLLGENSSEQDQNVFIPSSVLQKHRVLQSVVTKVDKSSTRTQTTELQLHLLQKFYELVFVQKKKPKVTQ